MNAQFILALSVLLIGTCICTEDNDYLTTVLKDVFGDLEEKDPAEFVVPISPTLNTNATKPQTTPTSCQKGEKCVKEYLCKEGTVDEDGDVSIFNPRFLNEKNEPVCPFLEKCCSTGSITEDPIVRPRTVSLGCGNRNIDGVGYRIESPQINESQFGEFPWMLAILRARDDTDTTREIYQCGGSLIHPEVALTAAHCVFGRKATDFAVRAGEWETNTQNELEPHQNRDVIEMVIHPKYNKNNLFNDVALLFLKSPFDLAQHINTVCLPPPGFVFDFSKCFATGWGKDQFENGKYQNILKKIELPIVPSYVCQDNLRKTRLGNYFKLNPSFICAGGERGKDTCEGDGGSPLVCPIETAENRFYQSGIVAWGIECGKENVPGVYVNVALFREWIDEELEKKHLGVSEYVPLPR
ncbi:phenoloxidase-activating factor 2-like [Eupeodes corollae]|uniref:phenoloxidase-activating factor 2-like n=1 Tax=Eupeodes corollae TaxID=290404 RepID=UPI002493A694|nr:phenoloxidase-activating factor 2-like [Eupeodes corollae]